MRARNYLAAFCPRCSRELATDGECYDCPNPPPAECHCCGRTDVQLYPWHEHFECNACSGLGDELQAERRALVTLLARVAVLAPRTVARTVLTTTGEEIRGAA